MKQKQDKHQKQQPCAPKKSRQNRQKKQEKQEKKLPYTLADILGAALPREDALAAILADAGTARIFSTFPAAEQERLIAFIQGAQGLKITYDSFFKYVMNPDTHPTRLERFLSAILGEAVKICMVLPLEGVRMADAGSFVIMDIVVELSDGTIVNIEIQKVGYRFPGERASCYSSDFIMRQYNRVKDARGDLFSFRDLKPVILIIIMEKSPSEFHAASPAYIHRETVSYDSGVSVSSLSKKIYISLDTFRRIVHNISNELEAWLTFLSSDRPADIIRLVSAYPEFLPCYRDIMEFRRNPKELIDMYSEALAILDHNTEVYMCEELKKENDALRSFLLEKDAALSEKEAALSEKDAENAFLRKQLHALMSKQ